MKDKEIENMIKECLSDTGELAAEVEKGEVESRSPIEMQILINQVAIFGFLSEIWNKLNE